MNVQVKHFFFETSGKSTYIRFFYFSDGIKVKEQRPGNKNFSIDREELFQIEFRNLCGNVSGQVLDTFSAS